MCTWQLCYRELFPSQTSNSVLLGSDTSSFLFGSVRSSMSHNLRLTLVWLELLIFIFLTQVSLRVSLRSHRSVWLYFGASNNSSCFSVSSEENQSKHLSPRILCFPSWDVRWYQGGKLDKHWEYWPLIGQYWSRDLNTGLWLVTVPPLATQLVTLDPVYGPSLLLLDMDRGYTQKKHFV